MLMVITITSMVVIVVFIVLLVLLVIILLLVLLIDPAVTQPTGWRTGPEPLRRPLLWLVFSPTIRGGLEERAGGAGPARCPPFSLTDVTC